MSSIHLQPLALESCRPGSLRERRRSSIRPRDIFPRLFLGGVDLHERESAIEDDPATDVPIADPSLHEKPGVDSISPLESVHLSGYSTNIDAARHQDALPRLSYTPESGHSTSPTSPTTSSKNSVIEIPPVVKHPPPEQLKLRLAAGYFMYFMCGWGDGITGSVIPYFEADFHLTPLTSSLLFAGSTVGFSAATILVEKICRFLSRFRPSSARRSFLPAIRNCRNDVGQSQSQGIYLSISYFSVLHASFFVLMGTKGGYPILLLAYAFAAFARGIVTAQLNLYYSRNHAPSMGYAYALWSFGGAISPLICQTIVARGTPWPNFYWGSLVLSTFNTCFLVYTFRPTLREFNMDRDKTLYSESNSIIKAAEVGSQSLTQSTEPGSLQAEMPAPPPTNTLRLALTLPYQWAVSVFSWLYCGCETTTQGFIVSYLLAVRSAKPTTVGYVTSGFWGGITIGRLLWGRYSSRLNFTQRKYTVSALLVLALVMQLLVWFVNSNVGNAFSAAIIGTVFGPIFPACLALANDLLPPDVHMVSMGLISAFASLGASIFPFVTGIIATVKGMQTLSYMTVAQSAALVALWCLFPSRLPRGRSLASRK